MYVNAQNRAERLTDELRILLEMHGGVWPLTQIRCLIAAELVEHAANTVVERERAGDTGKDSQ